MEIALSRPQQGCFDCAEKLPRFDLPDNLLISLTFSNYLSRSRSEVTQWKQF